jgi:hypothetical protein
LLTFRLLFSKAAAAIADGAAVKGQNLTIAKHNKQLWLAAQRTTGYFAR